MCPCKIYPNSRFPQDVLLWVASGILPPGFRSLSTSNLTLECRNLSQRVLRSLIAGHLQSRESQNVEVTRRTQDAALKLVNARHCDFVTLEVSWC